MVTLIKWERNYVKKTSKLTLVGKGKLRNSESLHSWSKGSCGLMTRIQASRIRCGCNIQIHTDYKNPVEEKGWRGHSLKRRAPDPCLDRLLFF